MTRYGLSGNWPARTWRVKARRSARLSPAWTTADSRASADGPRHGAGQRPVHLERAPAVAETPHPPAQPPRSPRRPPAASRYSAGGPTSARTARPHRDLLAALPSAPPTARPLADEDALDAGVEAQLAAGLFQTADQGVRDGPGAADGDAEAAARDASRASTRPRPAPAKSSGPRSTCRARAGMTRRAASVRKCRRAKAAVVPRPPQRQPGKVIRPEPQGRAEAGQRRQQRRGEPVAHRPPPQGQAPPGRAVVAERGDRSVRGRGEMATQEPSGAGWQLSRGRCASAGRRRSDRGSGRRGCRRRRGRRRRRRREVAGQRQFRGIAGAARAVLRFQHQHLPAAPGQRRRRRQAVRAAPMTIASIEAPYRVYGPAATRSGALRSPLAARLDQIRRPPPAAPAPPRTGRR